MTVDVVPLPVWRGGLLAAEYDTESDRVRVNRIAIDRVRERMGDDAARAFVLCAIAHERFHRENPHATEAQTHEHVRAISGDEPHRFDVVLRR